MIDDLTITERQIADLKAAEYIGKGYNVAREVSLEFLPGYRVDLVVEKDGERKVIEVTSRSSLRAMPALRELERVINSQPGWSFELQIIGEPERLTLPEAIQLARLSGRTCPPRTIGKAGCGRLPRGRVVDRLGSYRGGSKDAGCGRRGRDRQGYGFRDTYWVSPSHTVR